MNTTDLLYPLHFSSVLKVMSSLSAYCPLVHTAIWSHSTQPGLLLGKTNLEEASSTIPEGLQSLTEFSPDNQVGHSLKEPTSQMCVRQTSELHHGLYCLLM